MDPITQGTLGAAAALAVFGKRGKVSPSVIGWAGALGGMAADLDILIQSSTDPLLAIEYHRHFTHSLTFVPIGGTIAALPWLAFKKLRENFKLIWGASVLGYLTHAPLDCLTTYGTLFFWPWSDTRVALSTISIVDIVFTIPLLVAVIVAARRGARTVARWGLLYAFVYLGLGAIQRDRALDVQERLALKRGTPIERADVFPSFMNLVAWRSVYQSNGRYYVDQVRVPFIGRNATTRGAVVEPALPPPGLGPKGERAHRLLRWFSNDWVALDPDDSTVYGDLRYSFSPYDVTPIWGIRVDTSTDRVEWINNRPKRDIHLRDLRLLIFEDPPGSIHE